MGRAGLPAFPVTGPPGQTINLWSTATVTLNDKDITPLLEAQLDFDFTILALSGTLPESLRLADGNHTLNLTVNTHQGEQVNYSSMFTVAAGVNTNSHGEARAFENGVWVSWAHARNLPFLPNIPASSRIGRAVPGRRDGGMSRKLA